MELHPDTKIIDTLGGATAVARLCGGISPQAVSSWRRAGIPKARRMYLELLRPEAFDDAPGAVLIVGGRDGSEHGSAATA